MDKNSSTTAEITPETVQAEKWISPFVFIFKGKPWEVLDNGEVVPVDSSER